jgi:hypothetical protein
MPRRRWLWLVLLPTLLVVLAGAAIVWVVVWIGMPGESYRGSLPPADAALNALADALRAPVVELATRIGDRNVDRRPRELARAADYIASEFKAAGYRVETQAYQASGVECRNLEVELQGRTRPGEIVVVGAHYDSHPRTPAADDNATGVSAVLWLARRFQGRSFDRSLRLVAFTNEETPHFQTEWMGSWVYARRCRQKAENVTAMLSLEMIGYYCDTPGSQKYPFPFGLAYPAEGNFIAFIGNTASAGLVRQVVGAFRRAEPFPSQGAAVPESVPSVGYSDHWAFWQHGYPGLMVTDTAMFRNPYYHRAQDTPDKLDFDHMARVVRGLERVIVELLTVPPTPQ